MRAHHKIKHAESIAEFRSLPKSVRAQVLERDEESCRNCGVSVTPNKEEGISFALHHLIPFSAGGPDHPDNLITLCTDCHRDAHARMNSIVEERPDLVAELQTFVLDP